MNKAPSARLEARFDCTDGRTRMAYCFATSPLKIAKTFARENGVEVCVMDSSPGMLAGDHYSFLWQLGENAQVAVGAQGFSRIHPSRERPCQLNQRFELERGAWLDFFPEPLVLYKDAALRIETDIEMSASATLLLSEIVCAGRIARGEVFGFHRLQNRVRARCDGKLVFGSQTGVHPADLKPQGIGAWGDFTHAATLLILSARAGEELQKTLQAVLDQELHARVWSGVSPMERFGLFVALLGRRACDLQLLTHQLRDATRGYLR